MYLWCSVETVLWCLSPMWTWKVLSRWPLSTFLTVLISVLLCIGGAYDSGRGAVLVISLPMVPTIVRTLWRLNTMVLSTMLLSSTPVLDLITSIVPVALVMMRLSPEPPSLSVSGPSRHPLLVQLIPVVLIGFPNGTFDRVSVVEVLTSVGTLLLILGPTDTIAVTIRILRWKPLGKSGWTGWLTRWSASALCLAGWFLCPKKLFGTWLLVQNPLMQRIDSGKKLPFLSGPEEYIMAISIMALDTRITIVVAVRCVTLLALSAIRRLLHRNAPATPPIARSSPHR